MTRTLPASSALKAGPHFPIFPPAPIPPQVLTPFHADMSAMVDGLLKRMAEQIAEQDKRMAEQMAEQMVEQAKRMAEQIAEQDKRMAEQMAEQDQMIESLRKKIESLSEALPDAKRQKMAEQDKRMAERTLQN